MNAKEAREKSNQSYKMDYDKCYKDCSKRINNLINAAVSVGKFNTVITFNTEWTSFNQVLNDICSEYESKGYKTIRDCQYITIYW